MLTRTAALICATTIGLAACGDTPAESTPGPTEDATKSIREAVQAAAAAMVPVRLRAREIDLFEDDWVVREGALILLGEEQGRVVALTTRYAVDVLYPDPRLLDDGFGSAEIGRHYLEVGKAPPLPLRAAGVEQPSVSYEAHVVPIGDHDLALVYFGPRTPGIAGAQTLGLTTPTETILDQIARSADVFGLDLALVSRASLEQLRGGITPNRGGIRLVTLAAAALLGPAVGAVLGDVLDPAVVAELQRLATELATEKLAELSDAE